MTTPPDTPQAVLGEALCRAVYPCVCGPTPRTHPANRGGAGADGPTKTAGLTRSLPASGSECHGLEHRNGDDGGTWETETVAGSWAYFSAAAMRAVAERLHCIVSGCPCGSGVAAQPTEETS